MHHEADIAFVHAHSESGRRHNDPYPVIYKIILRLDFHTRIHLTVKRFGL